MSLYDELLAQGLPVISVNPQMEVAMGPMTNDQRRLYAAVILYHYAPLEYPRVIDAALALNDLGINYGTVMDTLFAYSNDTHATLPELRVQMQYVTTLLWKLMLVLFTKSLLSEYNKKE